MLVGRGSSGSSVVVVGIGVGGRFVTVMVVGTGMIVGMIVWVTVVMPLDGGGGGGGG